MRRCYTDHRLSRRIMSGVWSFGIKRRLSTAAAARLEFKTRTIHLFSARKPRTLRMTALPRRHEARQAMMRRIRRHSRCRLWKRANLNGTSIVRLSLGFRGKNNSFTVEQRSVSSTTQRISAAFTTRSNCSGGVSSAAVGVSQGDANKAFTKKNTDWGQTPNAPPLPLLPTAPGTPVALL